ncbi:MAG TPA: hypothetical protein VN081_02830, partial [Dongiaceae bacterium]|nr:hypothetical protein [Dongiaceae bacterium]
PGMAMGNTAKTLEDKLTSIPILGSAIANSQKKSIGEFNTATINKALAPIGKALPKGLSGRDAIAYLHDATSNAYTTILNRVGTVQADAPFIQDMAQLQANIGNMVNTTPEIRAKLQNIVQDEVLNKLPPNGQLEASLFKQIDSRLGSFSREFKGQNNVYANDAGGVVAELRQSLRDMLRRGAPEEAGALDAADRAFAIRSRITQAASSLGANEGVFTPAQLLNAVKSGDKSKGKRAFAQGDALLQDFADRAKSVMGSKYPDSGTAGRGILAALVTGGAGVTSPVGTAAGLTAASLPYLPFMRLTASEASKIPAKSVQKLGQLSSLLGQSPVTAVTTAPVANQLFQPKP